MAQSKIQIALIIITAMVFLARQIINRLPDNLKKDIFPVSSPGRISRKYTNSEIKPARSTFQIWKAIYLWQGLWMLYTLSLIFRKKAANVLSSLFYGFYILSMLLSTTWRIVNSQQHKTIGFAVLALQSLSTYTAVYFAYTGLYKYISNIIEKQNKIDVWCVRLLVINGVMFLGAWTTIATLVNFNTALIYEFGANTTTAGCVSLAILLTIVLGWFILENFIFEKYTRYAISHYITLTIGVSGILKKNWTDGYGIQGFILSILIVVVILFVARLVIIVYKERKRKGEEDDLPSVSYSKGMNL